MKRRILSIFPSFFHRDPAHMQGLGLAFVYASMALLQLFTFEDFGEVTGGFGLPGGHISAVVLMFLLPVAQIAALPYLLSMKLPSSLRAGSRVSVLIAAALWVVVALWTNATGNNAGSLGIFGATLYTPNYWWSVLFVALLAWAAWLMYKTPALRHIRPGK